eukprot:5086596-Alexandrium_andersonii.AAC.1
MAVGVRSMMASETLSRRLRAAVGIRSIVHVRACGFLMGCGSTCVRVQARGAPPAETEAELVPKQPRAALGFLSCCVLDCPGVKVYPNALLAQESPSASLVLGPPPRQQGVGVDGGGQGNQQHNNSRRGVVDAAVGCACPGRAKLAYDTDGGEADHPSQGAGGLVLFLSVRRHVDCCFALRPVW